MELESEQTYPGICQKIGIIFYVWRQKSRYFLWNNQIFLYWLYYVILWAPRYICYICLFLQNDEHPYACWILSRVSFEKHAKKGGLFEEIEREKHIKLIVIVMSKTWKNIPEIYHQRNDTYLCSNFLEVMFHLIIFVRNEACRITSTLDISIYNQ